MPHCNATCPIGEGESIEYVKRQLWHAPISLAVDNYGTHVPPGKGRGAIKRLAAMIENASMAHQTPETRMEGKIHPIANRMIPEMIFMEPAVGIEPTTC